MPRLVLLCLLAACAPPSPAGGPHYLYSEDPLSLDNPFPDARLAVDGVVTLRRQWYRPFLPPAARTAQTFAFFDGLTADAARELHGFGGVGGTLLSSSEPLDAASLPGTFARVMRDGERWRVLEREVRVQHVRDVLAERGRELPDDFPHFVFVRPSVPLPNDVDGALVVLRGAKTATGVGLVASAEAADSAGIAAALEVPASDVLLVLPERGPHVIATFTALARWAAQNPPAIVVPAHGIVNSGDGARPVGPWAPGDSDWATLTPYLERQAFGRPARDVGGVVLGELNARDLRDGVVMRSDWLEDPSAARVVPLRFVLSVPSGPKPPGGWPLVLGQHGVGGRNTPRIGNDESFCLEWAQVLAARGLACLGIDAPNHGSRGSFIDFFSLENLPALRDRFRQLPFDLLQVESAIAGLDVDGDGVGDFSPRVRFFGNSLGAILGSNFVPVSNGVTSAVLNVPGAGLSNLITSHYLRDRIGLLLMARTGVPVDTAEFDALLPVFRVASQPFFEAGDPLHMAAALPAERAVLQQLGLRDLTIPNDTSEDLAAALKLAGLDAELTSPTPIQALVRVDPGTGDGHEVLWRLPAVRAQALTFLESDGREVRW